MKKDSAVEWLVDQVEDFMGLIPTDIIEQAKAMEKEQIIDAYNTSFRDRNLPYNTAEKYYNKTFKPTTK
jgi:hypothetical protein